MCQDATNLECVAIELTDIKGVYRMKKCRNIERAIAQRRRGFSQGGMVRRLWFSLRLYREKRERERGVRREEEVGGRGV